MIILLSLLFALIGLAAAILINVLADHLPQRQSPQMPYCLQCGHAYGAMGWLGIRRSLRGACPQCHAKERKRPALVEGATAVLLAALPFFFDNPRNLLIYAIYLIILVLIIVIDLEHKLILNVVTFPGTAFAILGSIILTNEQNTLYLSLFGAAFGFFVFYLLYMLGKALFGAGALGYGDVKLSMLLGAMLGLHRIPFTLALAVLLGGVITLIVLLVNRRINRHTALPYGQYLALAGIVMIYWGIEIFRYYVPVPLP